MVSLDTVKKIVLKTPEFWAQTVKSSKPARKSSSNRDNYSKPQFDFADFVRAFKVSRNCIRFSRPLELDKKRNLETALYSLGLWRPEIDKLLLLDITSQIATNKCLIVLFRCFLSLLLRIQQTTTRLSLVFYANF